MEREPLINGAYCNYLSQLVVNASFVRHKSEVQKFSENHNDMIKAISWREVTFSEIALAAGVGLRDRIHKVSKSPLALVRGKTIETLYL